MKNLLWFFYKPADEREESVYQKAFARAFAFMTVAIGIFLYVIVLLPVELERAVVGWGALAMLIGAYLLGWTALRKEELALTYDPLPPFKPLVYLPIYAGVIIAAATTILLLGVNAVSVSILAIVALFFLLAFELVGILWCWRMTEQLPLYIRIVVSLLLQVGFVLYLALKKKNVATLVGSQIITGFAVSIIGFMLLFSVRLVLVEPIYVATDYFEPALEEHESRLVVKSTADLVADDYVVIESKSGQRVMGRFVMASADTYIVHTAGGDVTVPQYAIIGEVLPREVYNVKVDRFWSTDLDKIAAYDLDADLLLLEGDEKVTVEVTQVSAFGYTFPFTVGLNVPGVEIE